MITRPSPSRFSRPHGISSRDKDAFAPRSLLGQLTDGLFSGKRMGISHRIKLRRLKSLAKRSDNGACGLVYDLAQSMRGGKLLSME
jgi:hypothetical protein